MLITSDRWVEFLQLTEDTRKLQRMYRKNLDPAIRRVMEKTEDLLDATIAGIQIDMAGQIEAAIAAELNLESAAAVEGGAL
jgi:hypothetical protein